MTPSQTINHESLKHEIAEQDALAAVLAEMERKALAALSQEAANGWRHAQIILSKSWDVPRKLRQLHQLAKFWRETAPVKAAAYREAMVILKDHTGEEMAPVFMPEPEHAFALFELALAAT